MYHDDVPIIAKAMREDIDVFSRGVMFAILSARVQFPRVGDQCRQLAKDKDKAACLWGWKFEAYTYLEAHKASLFFNVCHNPDVSLLATKLWHLTRIPGLGIVKAAFVLQLLGENIACLDTINIQREGRNPRAFRSDGPRRKSTFAFEAKISRYVKETQGSAAYYWDQWCMDQGVKYGLTMEQVSALHVSAIVPKSRRSRDQSIPF